MGLLIKVILRYEQAHWRLTRYSGEVVSSAGPVCIRSVRSIALTLQADQHLVYSFDDTDQEHPALVTFIGGSEALRVSDMTEPELVIEVVTHLASLLGSWVNQYTDITVKNWAEEEWIGGEREKCNDETRLVHPFYSLGLEGEKRNNLLDLLIDSTIF